MRVKHLSLQNFRGFASLELDLDRPVTVLVGANGSGKTTVLRAIAFALAWRIARTTGVERPELSCPDTRDVLHGTRSASYALTIREVTRDGAPMEFNCGSTFQSHGVWSSQVSRRHIASEAEPHPFAFMVPTERFVRDANLSPTAPPGADRSALDLGVLAPVPGYARFIEWFKDREDIENARRVATRDLDLQDPQLRAVRDAVEALLPGVSQLRIDRESSPPAMVVNRGDVVLRLDQLSDGERNLVAMAGDIARRMVLADPSRERPLDAEGVLLIDEVEQHLHPAWQRRVIPALRRAFPNAQLVVTTHSPQVLSSMPASAVVVLDGRGAVVASGETLGRDANAILREVFDVPERPEETSEEVRAIAALIDDERHEEARERLEALAARLTEHDDAVLRLRTRLDFAEVGL